MHRFFVIFFVVLPPQAWAEFAARKAAFLHKHGHDYGYGENRTTDDSQFVGFVGREVGGRLGSDHYLDWAASALYTDSQIDAMALDLRTHLYGNPHSASASAERSTAAVEAARGQILDFLGATDDYEVIFTRSCTDSLRLVADTFPWGPGARFAYLVQNHNSVLGMRDVARSRGAQAYAVEAPPQDGADELSLFAFPGEENFAGEMFPLEWTTRVGKNWRVLVDAAKLAATHPINLTAFPADFVTMSFYKLFGSPTGVGALVVKKTTADELTKCYWGGGSVTLAGAGRNEADDLKILKSRICERFEDGTVAFLAIAALRFGFQALERVGGPQAIERHTTTLTTYLDGRLRNLTHANGAPLVVVYGPSPDQTKKGPVVNFNVVDSDASPVSHIQVMHDAAAQGIHLRAGVGCNPGAGYDALGIPPGALERMANDESVQGCGEGPAFLTCSADELASSSLRPFPSEVAFASDPGHSALSCATPSSQLVQVPLGSVRASLGYLSTFEDVDALAVFLASSYRRS